MQDDEQIFWINEQTGELVSNESLYGHAERRGGEGQAVRVMRKQSTNTQHTGENLILSVTGR